jgi:adenosylmethionine-8-amino-7-oxononanoate aminotransferase
LKSLALLRQKHCIDSLATIATSHQKGLESIRKSNLFSRIRTLGTIAAFDFNQRISKKMRTEFLESGLLLRPLGQTIYLMPPYCISEVELEASYQKIIEIGQHY